MWSRQNLKANAKDVLRRTYWLSFVLCLVGGLLAGVGNSSSFLRTFQTTFEIQVPLRLVLSVGGLGFLYSVFISNPINVGMNNFFMTSREYDAPFDKLFSAFNGSGYMKVVTTMLVQQVYVFLWSLLLFIPGIIKSLEYTFIPYIMAENPHISRKRAFELSKVMTNGEKMDIFVLKLSFIGWYLLGALLCFVGVYFVTPYVNATMAELYTARRSFMLGNGFATEEEFCGFNTTSK